MSISEDYQKPVGSRTEMKRATSMKLIHRIRAPQGARAYP